MYEPLANGDAQWRLAAGLERVHTVAAVGACRGFVKVDGGIIAVIGEGCYYVKKQAGAYVSTLLGALGGSGTVYFTVNSRTPRQIVAVTNGVAYEISTTAAPVSYPSSSVGSPNSCTFMDGLIVFGYGNGDMVHTEVNGLNINTVDRARAESRSDTLYRVIAMGGALYAFGSSSIEVWRNTANKDAFSFTRSSVISRGLAAPDAVSGYEEGWANTLVFVGDDNVVYALDGYTPRRISTHEVEAQIALVMGNPNKRLGFKAHSYSFAGHSIWSLSGPDWTLEYNISTGQWHERASYGLNKWRGAFPVWWGNEWYVGDIANGNIYIARNDYNKENDTHLVAEIRTAPLGNFPNKAKPESLEIATSNGAGVIIGSEEETDPNLRISWSKDGGSAWGYPVERPVGGVGEFSGRIQVNRIGLMSRKGLCVSLQWSFPLPFAVYGATLEA